MGRALLTTFFLFAMALFSIIACLVGFYSPPTIEIIDRLPLIISPIRFTYLMFFLVFIGLGYYCIQAFHQHISLIQTMLFAINALLQIIVMYYWGQELPMYALLGLIMLVTGIFVYYITFPNTAQSFNLRMPIAAWLSWTVFFMIITINYNMVLYEWEGFNLSDGLWAVIFLTIGTAFTLHLRYHYFDIVSPVIFIICYIGIIIANGLDQLFVSSCTLFLIGVMVFGILFIKKKKVLPSN